MEKNTLAGTVETTNPRVNPGNHPGARPPMVIPPVQPAPAVEAGKEVLVQVDEDTKDGAKVTLH